MAEAGIKPPKKGESQPAAAASASAPAVVPAPASGSEPQAQQPEAGPAPESSEKKAKKEKDKNSRMVYSDNEVSPEERMAKMPRYAFVPNGKEESALVDANTAPAVAAVVDE